MEGKEDLQISGIMKGEEVPDTYRLAPRNENPIQFSESTTPVTPPVVPMASPVAAEAPPVPAVAPPVVAPPTMAASPATPLGGVTTGTEGKKKRGRPRKYGPDGKPTFALSPMPISASIPLTGDYNTWTPSRGRPTEYKKKHKLEFASLSSGVAYSVGANFTPHMISVNAGEDVSMKIISFSQQGSRAICILAANGTISNVTLRQPNSSGGTLTYEGRFEILSLSGSFMPTDSGGTKSRTGGMSVSLAGPDGRVLGGGLAGLLIAAGPVQVVIGSFLAGHQQEQKPKKQKFDFTAPFSPVPGSANHHIFGDGAHQVFSGPQVTQQSLPPASQPSLTSASQPSLTPASYHGNNLDSGNAVHGPKILGQENNLSLSGESKDLSPSKCMVSC